MTVRSWIERAIEHLRANRIVFEPGLSDEEVARVEAIHGFRFPPDFRLFLQTALPVTGGFPNWRSESENDLRHKYLDRPTRGVRFDIERNGFWPEEWGPRPAHLPDALDPLHWYENYTFDLCRLNSAGRESWALPVYPDDNYTIILASDLRFGVFGNPLEKTFCVFGADLLAAMSDGLPRAFGNVVRCCEGGVQ